MIGAQRGISALGLEPAPLTSRPTGAFDLASRFRPGINVLNFFESRRRQARLTSHQPASKTDRASQTRQRLSERFEAWYLEYKQRDAAARGEHDQH